MNGVRDRAKGKLPLSIATSIAIESIIGHPEPTNEIRTTNTLGNYREMWINVKTLFRNVMGAMPSNSPPAAHEDLVIALLNEISSIRDIIGKHGMTKVFFYVSNYSRLESIYKNVDLRRDNTPKQKEYTALMTRTIQSVIKRTPKENDYFLLFNHELKPKQRNDAVILTHIPYDLVSAPSFGSLVLLESHTGKLKTKVLWYTKYYQGENLPPIPFTDFLLAVFGDREMFRPLKIDAKEQVIQLARKKGWTPLTTEAKMKSDIRELRNKYLMEVIRTI